MFRELPITVSIDARVVFCFPTPLSIDLLVVSNEAEETLWEFIAQEYQPVETADGSFHSWPIDEAPPEILAMLSEMQNRVDRELEVHGPRKPPISEVTYGELPAGYREQTAAAPLRPGEYRAAVFGQQGRAGTKSTFA